MKYLILTIFIAVVTFLVVGSSNPPRLTTYQKCVANASHLRSDRDTTEWVDAVCEKLPVEAGALM